MSSTRLPGKVLLNLNGRSVLSHVIERCQAISNVDKVCCAVSDNPESDEVAEEAERCGVEVFRGSEHDVLDRYYLAAQRLEAKIVVRITSDCPMFDPEVVAQVINLLIKKDADLATNNMPPTWPHGLDCEAFTFAWLERAWKDAVETPDREHVSLYIRRHPDAKIVNLKAPKEDLSMHRWTLDFPEDFEFMKAVFGALPVVSSMPSTADILLVLKKFPRIMELNKMHNYRN